jgi:D-3-phosphoglycerate dehydrogenase
VTRVAVTCIQLLRDLANHRGPLDALGFEIVTPVVSGQHLEGAELVAAMDGCVGVVAGDDKFTADVLAQLPELRVISKWGIGIDGIDLDAAADHGIVVRNTPGMFDDEVADVTMAYVVNLLRELATIDRGVRTGTWPKPPGRSLRGLTLGIVGLGGIGRAVARRAAVAGMTVIGFDPSESSRAAAAADGAMCCDLDELWQRADVISVNCPLNDATRHLVDAASITAMRDGVFIVNTGRGPVIDTDALLDGLRSGKVAGAALDVLETEPLPSGHPLTEFDQVMFGSHNASNTLDASARVHDVAIGHLIDELAASP